MHNIQPYEHCQSLRLFDLKPVENEVVFNVATKAMSALPMTAVIHVYGLPAAARTLPFVAAPSTAPVGFGVTVVTAPWTEPGVVAAAIVSLPPVPHAPF